MRSLLQTTEEITPGRFPNVNLWMPWLGQGARWWQDTAFATPAVSHGNAVRQMMDASDRRHNFETTGDSTRPTVNISAGERPSLAFNGSHWLFGSANNNLSTYPGLWRGGTGPSDLASFANHVYMRPSTVSSVITIASRWQTASTGGWWVHYSSAVNKWQAFFRTENVASGGAPDIQLDSANAATVDTWYRVAWGYDHVAKSFWLKINDETTVSTTSAYQLGRPGAPCRIGTRATTNETTLINLWNGRIGEMVGVARASFTDSELALLKSRGPTL